MCSYVVPGVVCSKNVANKLMPSSVQKPHVALMLGSIEYQRDGLPSMDTLLAQVKNRQCQSIDSTNQETHS